MSAAPHVVEDSQAAEVAAQSLRDGAWRIVKLVRVCSPSASDELLYSCMALATGIFFANAVYPEIPEEGGVRTGRLFAAGMMLGREARTAAEKSSCAGAA